MLVFRVFFLIKIVVVVKWCGVIWYVHSYVSEETAASIFMSQKTATDHSHAYRRENRKCNTYTSLAVRLRQIMAETPEDETVLE
jgi:hypothetical protein